MILAFLSGPQLGSFSDLISSLMNTVAQESYSSMQACGSANCPVFLYIPSRSMYCIYHVTKTYPVLGLVRATISQGSAPLFHFRIQKI